MTDATAAHDCILENWILGIHKGASFLVGNTREDSKKRFEDGATIHTSYLVTDAAEILENQIVQTLNTKYLLGSPCTDPEAPENLKKVTILRWLGAEVPLLQKTH